MKLSPGSLGRRGRLMFFYLFGILLLVMVYTVLYRHFMLTFEGRERDLFQALQVVVETMTTVGYGEDAPWSSPQVNILVIAMQLTGLVALFTLLPLFVLPWVEERLRQRWVPTKAPRRLKGHVLICGHSPLAEALAEELLLARRPFLIMARDGELVARLTERYPAIHGDASHLEDLERAGAERASALVANEDDERNAAIALSASAFKGLRVLSVVKDIRDKLYLLYAGADVVVSPREIMGLALADKALSGTPFHLSDLTSIAPDLEIAELPVQPGSPLIAQTLAEAEVGERTGARVIGVWSKGEFISAPGPGTRIDEGSVLVAAGSKGQLERLEALALSSRRRALREGEGRVIILGCGEVGRRVKELLGERGIATLMVDLKEGPEVDLVGDALEETLKRAGIEEARTLIVALDDDIRGIFAILVARRLNPQLQIVARANEEEMVNRMYRAGANYVLSLAAVGGRALASHLLGREVIALGKRVRIERLPLPPRLVGKTIDRAGVRSRTGCTVVAVERGGRTEVEITPQFKFQEGDTIIISGSDEDIQQFHRLFGRRPAPTRPRA